MRRIRFFARAVAEGWSWLVGVWNHVGLALAVLALFGVGAWAGFRHQVWWTVVGYLAALVLVCYFEGSYRIYRELAPPDRGKPFPDVHVRARPLMYQELPDYEGWHVIYYVLNVVNRESARRAALEFELSEEFTFSHPSRGPIRMALLKTSLPEGRSKKVIDAPPDSRTRDARRGLGCFQLHWVARFQVQRR